MMLDCLINGEKTSSISVEDRGLQYGDGLFETLLWSNNQALMFNAHYQRMQTGARALQLPMPDIAGWLRDIQSLQKDDRCVIKLILTRGASGRGYAIPEHATVTRIALAYAMPASVYPEQGLKLKVCHTPVSENSTLAGIKHLNRLENVLARSELLDCHEGLMLDRNSNVIEATQSNLFGVKDNTLITPALTASGIKGIVRQWLMDKALETGVSCQERDLPLAELQQVDELLLCNSVMGIRRVSQLEQKNYVRTDMYQYFKQLYQQEFFSS